MENLKENEYLNKYKGLEVIENFRDLGGYKVAFGLKVKDGMIFRSGATANLNDGEKALFDALNINHIIDFRSETEVEKAVDYVPSNCSYDLIPVIRSEMSTFVNYKSFDEAIAQYGANVFEEAIAMIGKLYSSFPFENKAYAQIFEYMDKGDRFLFHCTAGKDRTGIASVLILTALGASEETIRYDYLVTNFYRKTVNEKLLAEMKKFFGGNFGDNKKIEEMLEIALNVSEKYLDISLNAIKKKYGTIDNCLLKEYGIDDDRKTQWRKYYCE